MNYAWLGLAVPSLPVRGLSGGGSADQRQQTNVSRLRPVVGSGTAVLVSIGPHAPPP